MMNVKEPIQSFIIHPPQFWLSDWIIGSKYHWIFALSSIFAKNKLHTYIKWHGRDSVSTYPRDEWNAYLNRKEADLSLLYYGGQIPQSRYQT